MEWKPKPPSCCSTSRHKVESMGTPLVHTQCQARLLAVFAKETGAWLNALPILRMDDDVIWIAVGLRLGIPICHPQQCHHCKATVGELGSHGLSCSKNESRYTHHATINSIVQRYLMVARIPSILEPAGLSHSDGQRPDGVTIAPWKSGCLLV